MTCISEITDELLLSNATPEQCEEFVKKNTDEMYYVPAGYRIGGVALMGRKAIPIGISGPDLIFQFVKPCRGFFVLKMKDAQDEIDRLRAKFKK
ncbi:MAG TPA: DUF1894 domain-containing protein [Methanosarcinaceae archaeon]|nr:DUF1894 domain-containing protein [Methanosarcinaceae archaeon]